MATRLASQRNFVTITPTTNQNQSQSLSEMATTSTNNGEIITITSTGNTSMSESIHHNETNIPLQQVYYYNYLYLIITNLLNNPSIKCIVYPYI